MLMGVNRNIEGVLQAAVRLHNPLALVQLYVATCQFESIKVMNSFTSLGSL